jgi:hypothetical protein
VHDCIDIVNCSMDVVMMTDKVYKYSKLNPDSRQKQVWITGTDPYRREKYYAFLQHRNQANFRKEEYELTFDDWEVLWSDSDLAKRGRSSTSLSLFRIDRKEAWSITNVDILQRKIGIRRMRGLPDE